MIKFISSESPDIFKNKTILLRIDLNINPGSEKDSFRLNAILPTIKKLLEYKASIILLSHRGRPTRNPQLTTDNSRLSLKPFAKILSKKLKKNVQFTNSLTRELVNSPTVTLLENLRFDPREEKNDREYAKELAKLGNVYINDSFAVSHRANASVSAITEFLPSYAGLLLEKEIENLNHAMTRYESPLTLILGGIKIQDKIGVIDHFRDKAAHILVGGGVGNTFLKARGVDTKNSITDNLQLTTYNQLPSIVVPEDVKFHKDKILDIGPKTIKKFTDIISASKTIIWNGPVGMFEKWGFDKGTKAVWQAILKNKTAFSIVGGGETTSSIKLVSDFVRQPADRISDFRNVFISTGGGAMLEYLSGKTLPGIKSLTNQI